MAWSPELVKLFRDAKVCITSSPMLAWYNSGKPTFLKTDWSAKGMGCILMQPDNDKTLTETANLLLKTGEYVFDTTK